MTTKERPILFSAPMVRAILDGEKTQTRRPVKPQPIPAQDLCVEECVCDTCLSDDPTQYFIQNDKVRMASHFGSYPVDCPYGKPGDRLWVRETWAQPYAGDRDPRSVIYLADGPDYVTSLCDQVHNWGRKDGTWKSPILMPRWASRLTLEITNVRVERVQRISPADGQAEGFGADTFRLVDFGLAWEGMYAKKPGLRWDDNPWVWVVEFRRVEDV